MIVKAFLLIFKRERVIAMPWNMQDYPDSLKNFDELLRKKIIDIANALVQSGYDEGSAIPIATSQGKEWYQGASQEDLDKLAEEPNPSINDQHDSHHANPDLLDEDIEVFYEEERWKLKTQKAKRASDSFDNKQDALKRAQEIAENRNTKVISYTKEGKRQK